MMKHLLTILLIAGFAFTTCRAEVVNPAPDFSWPYSGSDKNSLRKLRGQPVILIIARSPDSRAFRKQADRLEDLYEQFASRGVVFIAAFTESADTRIATKIPFVVIAEGSEVAARYGVTEGFCIVVIGEDGNIDMQTRKVQSSNAVRDVVINSFVIQEENRD